MASNLKNVLKIRINHSLLNILSGIGLLGLGVGAYGYWIEPFRLEVTRRDVRLGGMDPRMDGFSLLQISDIHISDWMLKGYLDRVVAQANALQPDVIALTGDYLYRDLDGMEPELRRFFSSLKANQAVVAILGNHDHWDGPDRVVSLFAETGITDLTNTTIEFSRDGGRLIVAGLDDPWEKKDQLDQVAAHIPDGQKAVLLVHEPDYAEKYAAADKFSIQISGHTHGGQVRIPWLGAVVTPEHGSRYQAGMYRVGDMWVYTNRGIGAVPIRLRLNCRPEITFFRFFADRR
jgi:predicted MPP superfamily phosphohydrolase